MRTCAGGNKAKIVSSVKASYDEVYAEENARTTADTHHILECVNGRRFKRLRPKVGGYSRKHMPPLRCSQLLATAVADMTFKALLARAKSCVRVRK